MISFTICPNHSIDEMYTVDAQGHVMCVFCKLKDMREILRKVARLSLHCECRGNGREIVETCTNCSLMLEVAMEAQELIK